VANVRELVGDDDARLGAALKLDEQRVEEDDPARRPDARRRRR
jgi:hypothetical protein